MQAHSIAKSLGTATECSCGQGLQDTPGRVTLQVHLMPGYFPPKTLYDYKM